MWLSLMADAAVVVLAAEVGVRALRRRGSENDLDRSVSQHYASLTVDQEGTILTWSDEAHGLTGYSAEQTIGNTFSFLLTPVTADIGLQAQLLRTALQSEKATTECWLVSATGERRWVHLSLAPLVGEERWARRFLLVLRDLNETAGVQEALRDHEGSLERILDSATDAIITIDDEQRIVMFNAAAERMFLCERQKTVGQPLDVLIPERYRLPHRRHVDAFGASGATSRHNGEQSVLTALRGDGSEFPIEASISRTRVRGRSLYTVILRDVTERMQAQRALKRSHEELRQLAVALQSAREDEKTDIARELHDKVGQGLTSLKSDVAWLMQNVPGPDQQTRDKLRLMGVGLDRIVAEMHRVSADLRPLVLDDLGFGAAAEWLINDFKMRTGTTCDCRLDQSVQDIDEPVATALFRALQESLTNVARHAQASRVDIQVVRDNGAVQLEVSDNGKGIGETDSERPGSSGLRALAQRAMVLGGEVKTTRLDSGGTRVVFRVPVNGHSDADAHQ